MVGAQVAVAVGAEFTQCSVGVENMATGRAVTPDTLFQIGSTTKVFTAVLLMQLVDAGLVDIDAPVASYLPDFRLGNERATRTVTPRHLMSMTSGIDDGPCDDPGWGPDAVRSAVETVADLPVMGQPGTGFGYSNSATNITGRIIEVLTGSTWDTALRERLLEPAGLRHSASLVEDQVYHPVAVGHIATEHGPRHTGPWILGRPEGLIRRTTTELFPLGEHRFLPERGVLGGDQVLDVAFYMDDDGRAQRFLYGPLAARHVG
ncbi:serine hydrolase domain-containing protein [Streptomyces sp. NPDC054961]